jgi:predicted branched-subunit amino acid permease
MRAGAAPVGPPITAAGLYRGAREVSAVCVYAFVFGVAFGAAADDAGMAGWAALLMSMTVYAGGSQFAALELWSHPIAWAPLLVATLGINGRHLLLGASLYSWLWSLPRRRLYLAAFLLSDPNWATAVQARSRGEQDAGILIGGGIALWIVWVAGTLAGIWLIEISPEDFRRFGLDLIFLTFLAVVLTGIRRDRSDDLAWCAAAAGAVLAVLLLPPHWHVLAGGLAGGLAGMLAHRRGYGRARG